MTSEVHKRLNLISRARTILLWPEVAMLALMVWTMFAWALLEPGVAVALCLPPAALVLAARRPAVLTLWGRGDTDIRTSLAMALITGFVVPIGAAWKVMNVANLGVLVLPAVIIGGAATIWSLAIDPALRARPWDSAAVAVCLVLHAGALVFWLDHVLPPAQERRAEVTVTGLRKVAEHKGVFSFRVQTSAAPTTEPWNDYVAWRADWLRLTVGAPACVVERHGLLGVTELTVSPCLDRLP